MPLKLTRRLYVYLMRCFCAKNYDLAISELARSFPLLYFVRLCRFVIRYLSHRETVDLIYEMNLKLRGSVKKPSFVNKCVKVSAYSPLDFKACVVVRVLKKLNHTASNTGVRDTPAVLVVRWGGFIMRRSLKEYLPDRFSVMPKKDFLTLSQENLPYALQAAVFTWFWIQF